MEMATQTPISIRFQDDVREQLDQFAGLSKRSRNYIVNEAVAAYTRDQLQRIAEIDAAVQEAKSGVGYSKESVFAWLRSKGTDNPLPRPEPDILPE
jgi:predicted transcriptional regulator